MAVTISGILKNASGVRPNTQIRLKALTNTSTTTRGSQDFTITTDANGAYSFDCNNNQYVVHIVQPGFPYEEPGIIAVYPDSTPASLEDFLVLGAPDSLTPAIVQQVIDARDEAQAAAAAALISEQNAEQSEQNALTSENAAALSESNAATSESNALASANAAAQSESNAATSESNASASESNALASANAAAISESNAAGSESNAAASESNAAASEDLARRWAEGDTPSGQAPSDTRNAEYFALLAEQKANQIFVNGGLFTPTGGQEYPDVSGVSQDTAYIIDLPRGTDYTYMAGPLAGQLVIPGDIILYDLPTAAWSAVEAGLIDALTETQADAIYRRLDTQVPAVDVSYDGGTVADELDGVNERINVGDSLGAGGLILPVENRSAVNGENLTGASFVKLQGGDFSDLTKFPMVKKDGSRTPLFGNLSNINLAVRPYSATVGSDDVWLLDANFWGSPVMGIPIKAFWAVGDYVADDTDPFIRASIHAALSKVGDFGGVPSLFLNAGFYKITQTSPLSQPELVNIRGFDVFGEGGDSSVLVFENNTGTTWTLITDTSSTAYINRSTFRDIGITCTDPDNFVIFRLDSDGSSDKQLRFESCNLGRDAGNAFGGALLSNNGISGVFDLYGNVNADLMKLIRCNVIVSKYVFRLNNPQSVQHDIVACDIITSKDVVAISNNGGGNVNIYGGGIIWDRDNLSPDDGYIFNFAGGGIAFGNQQYNIDGTRLEITGGNKGLVKCASAAAINVKCTGISIAKLDLDGATRNLFVDIKESGKVYINGSTLAANGGVEYRINTNSGNASSVPGEIHVTDSVIIASSELNTTAPVDKFEINGSTAPAIVKVKNCSHNSEKSSPKTLYTFNKSNLYGGIACGYDPYTALLKGATEFFPVVVGGTTPTNEKTLRVPAGAILESFHVNKPANAGDLNEDYQVLIGNDDKTSVYASTNLQNARLEINEIININRRFDADTTIRLWGSTQSINTAAKLEGFCYIKLT